MSEVVAYPKNVSITEVTVTKPKANMKVGISLKNAIREAGIAMTGLTENSPLRGTAIRSKGGQVLLAVNGDPNIPDVASAAALLGSRQRLSLLVCEQHDHYNSMSSCIQIVAAPFFKHNPGVNFSSTRGRTLVTISKIFKSGPFAGNKYLHKGDIVLAVNGIAVSKPEDADRALRYPPADGSVTVLHVVDINYFRSLLLGAVDSKVAFKPDKTDNNKCFMLAQRSGGSTSPLPLCYDPETQHLYDPSPYKKLMAPGDSSSSWDFKNPKVFYKSWYQRVISFLDNFNKRMDAALDPLEDLACEYAWRSSPLHLASSMTSASPSSRNGSRNGSPREAVSPGTVLPTVVVDDSDVYVPLSPPSKSPKNDRSTPAFIAC